jgi:Flp pilus assembly CpaE family ATPase
VGNVARDRNETNGSSDADIVLADLERDWTPSRSGTRVAIGIRDLGFHQEVQDFLGRDPRLQIVGAAVEAERAVALLRELTPDVMVVCPSLARELRHPVLRRVALPLVMVAEEMTVPTLREAIEAGAQAVFSWPEERDELARSLVEIRSNRQDQADSRARVIAVYGARGGAGATFLATHLSAALADLNIRTALVDLDVAYSDVSAALGVPADSGARTIADLVPVMDELSPEHLDDALFRHPRGFSALLGPLEPSDAERVKPGLYRGAIALLACDHDALVLHLPRAVDRVAKVGIELADIAVLVTTLDLFSLYGARRTMGLFAPDIPTDRWRVVLNKPSRSSLSERNVERVLGIRPMATVRSDGRIGRAQERGDLIPTRSGAVGRDLRKLASLLVPGTGTSAEGAGTPSRRKSAVGSKRKGSARGKSPREVEA